MEGDGVGCKHEIIDTGTIFGRLITLDIPIKRSKSGDILYCCKCECGSDSKYYYASKLRTGHTKSCGCFRKEETAKRNKRKK